jgi:hypothetical protein
MQALAKSPQQQHDAVRLYQQVLEIANRVAQ